MIDQKPKISVLLPVYNAEKYLQEAIESILNQRYSNFELILLDDGSTDTSSELIETFQKKDSRIKSFPNSENRGLIYTLNKGLSLVKGDYIARMDADDIAHPERFFLQLNYLEKNSDVVLIGSNYTYFGNSSGTSNLPLRSNDIKLNLYFKNVIAHPTVMMRTSTVLTNKITYNADFIHMEDWALWHELKQFGEIVNLPENLISYRLEGQNISILNASSLEARAMSLFQNYLADIYNKELNSEELKIHWQISNQIYLNEGVRVINNRINSLKNNLLQNTKFSNETIDEFIQGMIQKYFFKISDESFFQGMRFMMRNGLIASKYIKYLFGKLIK